jgi:methylenetetrahydrofolate reductase (NADPH)
MRHSTLETGQELENNNFMPTLKEKLASDRFVITAEIAPPVSCDAADLMAKAAPLKGLADAVNVTDGAGARAHLGSVARAAILIQEGIEPILQFTCRDRNRIALQSELMAAAALGIRNLLLLKGDDPKQGDQPEAKPVFDYDYRRADRGRRGDARQGRVADRQEGRRQGRSSSSRRPTCRSIRRPAGSRKASRPRSRPAASSCRPSSAWMPAWRGATGAARRARRAGAVPDRDFAAALCQVGALDEGEAVRNHHPDATIARLEAAGDPAAEGRKALRRLDAGAGDHSGRRRRAHHGARQ